MKELKIELDDELFSDFVKYLNRQVGPEQFLKLKVIQFVEDEKTEEFIKRITI